MELLKDECMGAISMKGKAEHIFIYNMIKEEYDKFLVRIWKI